jgi:hypothetical protein
MERWTFLIIADGAGDAAQIRMVLRAGDDPSSWPTLQVAVDGTEVPVDDAEKDYEAPEWRAVELFTAAGGGQARWDELKDHLRARV